LEAPDFQDSLEQLVFLDFRDKWARLAHKDSQDRLDSWELLDYRVHSEIPGVREVLVLRVLLEALVAQDRRATPVFLDRPDSQEQLAILV